MFACFRTTKNGPKKVFNLNCFVKPVIRNSTFLCLTVSIIVTTVKVSSNFRLIYLCIVCPQQWPLSWIWTDHYCHSSTFNNCHPATSFTPCFRPIPVCGFKGFNRTNYRAFLSIAMAPRLLATVWPDRAVSHLTVIKPQLNAHVVNTAGQDNLSVI